MSACAIVFLVDAKDGLTPGDRLVADRLRRLALPILFVANKVEGRSDEATAAETAQLGFGSPLLISALEGHGITDLLDAIVEVLPAKADDEDEVMPSPALKIAVVGKRNSGKSSLINAWAQDERVIVSEMPGTTRDAVDVVFEYRGRSLMAIDTAGLRKKSSVQDAIEFFSLARAESAIRRADVVLLLFDMRESVSNVDKKLAQVVIDNFKPCVIGGNKLDLGRESEPKEWERYIRQQLKGLSFAPILFLSAKDGTHLTETLDLLADLGEQARIEVPTPDLNRVLTEAKRRRAPESRGKVPKLYYATQIGTLPPRVLVFCNEPRLFRGNYDRYLQNSLREHTAWKEIPIQLIDRRRERDAAGAEDGA